MGSFFNNLGKKRKICHLRLQLEWRNTTQAVAAGLESKRLNRHGELQRKKRIYIGAVGEIKVHSHFKVHMYCLTALHWE